MNGARTPHAARRHDRLRKTRRLVAARADLCRTVENSTEMYRVVSTSVLFNAVPRVERYTAIPCEDPHGRSSSKLQVLSQRCTWAHGSRAAADVTHLHRRSNSRHEASPRQNPPAGQSRGLLGNTLAVARSAAPIRDTSLETLLHHESITMERCVRAASFSITLR